MQRALLPILLVLSAPVAAVEENVDYVYYDVHHESGESLPQAITSASTVGKGKGFHGYTEWFVRWQFRWRYDERSCWITDVDVTLDATITLPELYTDDARAQARFDRYIAALTEHEEGHLANGRQAAEEVAESIADLERNTCAELEADANAIGKARVKAANARDKAYDKRTQHGRTEGAWITD